MRIVKYNTFINEAVNHDALAQSVEDCLVELRDAGFEVKVAKVRNNFSGICLFITIKKSNDGKFKMKDLKESFDVMIDLLDEGFTYDVETKFRLVFSSPNYDIESFGGYYLASSRNTWFDSDIDLFGLEIKGIKGKSNIIRSYESSSYTGYSGFKAQLIEEVDNVLVELKDDNFWFSRELSEKDGNYVLDLWVEREVPEDFDQGQLHDWREDNLDLFYIREVYEPLSLLVEWMKEKYDADLVENNMYSNNFKIDSSLDKKEFAVSLKFIWKK